MTRLTRRPHAGEAWSGRARVIDAHHHLWRFNESEFGWIDERMSKLRRDYLANDLCKAMAVAKVDGTVVVQARESVEETKWLLDCARETPVIAGVVGWAPLTWDNLAAIIDSFDGGDTLVGLREVVQGLPDGYFDRPEFNRGVRALTERGLTYDILIYQHQLEEAIRLVDRHPNQRFVLDHAGKPKIAQAEIEPWRTNLLALSKRANVTCKISGLVTEADWSDWTPESLRPYLDACVDAFGPHRLMAGSDWPVCLVATGYSAWWDVLRQYFEDFSSDEFAAVFGGTAVGVYGLQDAPQR